MRVSPEYCLTLTPTSTVLPSSSSKIQVTDRSFEPIEMGEAMTCRPSDGKPIGQPSQAPVTHAEQLAHPPLPENEIIGWSPE